MKIHVFRRHVMGPFSAIDGSEDNCSDSDDVNYYGTHNDRWDPIFNLEGKIRLTK